MMSDLGDRPRLTPTADKRRLYAVLRAIEVLTYDDLVRYHAWDDLADLSSNTIFDAIEGTPEGVFEALGDKFEATATVYVTLQYGSGRDSTSMNDSYPAIATGSFSESNEVQIESISVDTSSFYEDEFET